MKVKRLLGFFFCFIELFISGVYAQSPHFTLNQCIEQALVANYSIKMVRNEQSVAENNVTYAPFLPMVGLDVQQSQKINDTKTKSNGEIHKLNGSETNSLSAGVGLNWRLFDGMAMFTTYERYQEMQARGELKTQMIVENLIVEVSSAYYNVIVQHSKLEASKHSLELSTERYNEARDKYMLGVLSGLELQQAKIDLNADSSKYMKQKELLKSSYISLNMLMNSALEQDMYVRDSIVLRPVLLLEELRNSTLEYNTSLLMARKDQKISAMDVKLARSALFPTLDFNGGYNYSLTKTPQATTTLNRTNGVYWGFTLSMNVFECLENHRKIKNARLQQEYAEWSYREIELQILADLAQLYNTYENNLQIVNFENESAEVAFENLDAALEKYKLGSLSGIEFREFQRSYIDAVDRKLASIYQAKVSELSLLLISGRIGEMEQS
ncbi:MAG: TolC family protein [Oscillibacter sp.]|nr:TolC family protein [Oscillibacter sp.]